jgi:signal transduction histidine kinase
MRLNLELIELSVIIENALETVRPAAEAKKINLITEYDSTVPAVLGDPDRLQQIFWNLISNAVKFTPDGGAVYIELKKSPEFAEIVVCDTGNGIEPDFLPFVFERFRQADASLTRRFGGLGLGLALVKHLTELHGGTVSVESRGIDTGATFIVKLPLNSSVENQTD